MTKNKTLGKGLSVLIGEPKKEDTAKVRIDNLDDLPNNFITEMTIDNLIPGKYQPRRHFKEEMLHELADSIKKCGLIQPILIREIDTGKFEIVAGERRWRASKIAGLKTVPVIVKKMTDKEALEIAIVENVQRQDLNPVEEAEGYKSLIEDFNYTQEDIANSVAKSRSHIANMLRLLTLPEQIKDFISQEKLTMGHARCLVGLPEAETIAEKIIKSGLSVRQTEKLIKQKKNPEEKPVKNNKPAQKNLSVSDSDEDLASIEKSISNNIGMKVKIEDTDQGGKVTIFFHNLEELDSILQKLSAN